MFTKERIFALTLENYSCPRHLPETKSYYGTMEEMIELMLRLENDPATALRYKKMLDAAEFYDFDNDITHNVAGYDVPVFTQVEEVCRLETTLRDQEWEYQSHSGTLYPCKASHIELRQMVLRTPNGYEHAAQANITGLQVCYPGIGWICPNGAIKGFPHMVTLDGHTHRMALAVSLEFYLPDYLEHAMEDGLNPEAVDLSYLVEDILGEG